MAASYTWPLSLPQSPQKGYSETGGVLTDRTPQDSGPAKLRYIGNKPQVLSVTFLMTTAQVTTLENFVKNTTRGTARFYFPHPRLSTPVEARIVPQGEGEYYTLSYVAPGYYSVPLILEVLP
jgi:hypothetical protein